MRLDQLAMDVDPDQGAVRADLNLPADIPTRRHRIQSAIQPHMVMGVNLAVDAVGGIEASGFERNQSRLLLGVENIYRYRARGSMDTAASCIATAEQIAAS